MVLTWLFLAAAFLGGAADSAPATHPQAVRAAASQPAGEGPRIVDYQPGVRIDFRRRQVEVEATVILRQGLVELFACSPGIREHESIVRIEARPVHLYQALGLIGLTPGHPVRYDEEREEVIPARGDSVTIEVRYRAPDLRQVPIEQWLRRTGGDAPVEAQPWVFAGSEPVEDGLLATDLEGTVIAVVDFPSALIALPESHSDSNEVLWLEPLTESIPAVGTRCTVVIRPGPIRIELDRLGRARLNGRPATLIALVRELNGIIQADPQQMVSVRADRHCPVDELGMLESMLRAAGFAREPDPAPADDSRPADAAQLASRWVLRAAGSRPATQPSAVVVPATAPR